MRSLHKKITIIICTAAMFAASACSGGKAPATADSAASSQTEIPETETDTSADAGNDAAGSTADAPGITTDAGEAGSGEPVDPTETEKPAAETTGALSDAATAAVTTSLSDKTTAGDSGTPAETVTNAETTEAETTTAAATEAETTTAAATEAETTAPAATEAETTAPAAETKPAAPSPPRISPVSSPGTNTFTADNIVFDYSNCAKGYASVNYTGSTRLKMRLLLGDSIFDYDIFPGKGAQYITLAQGSGDYTVEIYEMLDNGKFRKSIKEDFSVKISDEVDMFTYTNYFVDFSSSSACVAKASEICAGCTSSLDKIAAVFRFVTGTITYDKQKAATVTGGYIPDPDRTLSEKKGICFDYASLTAAMLRSQGIPTRLITGYAKPGIYHAWNEVYTPDTGWITVEIMLDGSGFKRIDATFYASAADKNSFAEYIAESGNYSDVYVY